MCRFFRFVIINEAGDSIIAFYPILTQPLSIIILTIILGQIWLISNDRLIPLLCYFHS